MKDKKLHHVLSHSNYATKAMLLKYDWLEKAKDIAKINQVTDLLISIKNQPELMDIIQEASEMIYLDTANHSPILFGEDN